MALTPYQQSIWLVMCARNVGYAGVAFIMIAMLAVMGVRFMDHQIAVGIVAGAALFLVSDRIIRYIPDPNSTGPSAHYSDTSPSPASSPMKTDLPPDGGSPT